MDGKFYAVDAICSHRSGYLPKGKLEKNVVICPAHGVQFDVITGKIYKDLPGLMKMITGRPTDLKTYKVEIKESAVFIDA